MQTKRRTDDTAEQLVTPAEAGKILDVTPGAVRAIEARGELAAMRTLTGRRLYRLRDVEALAEQRRKASSEKLRTKKR